MALLDVLKRKKTTLSDDEKAEAEFYFEEGKKTHKEIADLLKCSVRLINAHKGLYARQHVKAEDAASAEITGFTRTMNKIKRMREELDEFEAVFGGGDSEGEMASTIHAIDQLLRNPTIVNFLDRAVAARIQAQQQEQVETPPEEPKIEELSREELIRNSADFIRQQMQKEKYVLDDLVKLVDITPEAYKEDLRMVYAGPAEVRILGDCLGLSLSDDEIKTLLDKIHGVEEKAEEVVKNGNGTKDKKDGEDPGDLDGHA
jgi:hypothetical protein